MNQKEMEVQLDEILSETVASALHRENTTFFLRPHDWEVWDLVCYAVPKNRLK
jgi:hypothetical protein